MTERAREGLFSSLGGAVVDAQVLDLYAGSGSLGLEALSRGAAGAIFVELQPKAVRALRQNILTLDLGGTVVVADVLGFVVRFDGAVDIAFVDPPYDLALPSVVELLARLVGHLEPGGIVIVHRRRGGDTVATGGLVLTDRRTYGDTELFRLMKEER